MTGYFRPDPTQETAANLICGWTKYLHQKQRAERDPCGVLHGSYYLMWANKLRK